jgi:hypothetical protein
VTLPCPPRPWMRISFISRPTSRRAPQPATQR